jgi:hypothetical protein
MIDSAPLTQYAAIIGGCHFYNTPHIVALRSEKGAEPLVWVTRRPSDNRATLAGVLLGADGKPTVVLGRNGLSDLKHRQGVQIRGNEDRYRAYEGDRCILDFQKCSNGNFEFIASFLTSTPDGRLLAFHPDMGQIKYLA